VPNKVSFGLNEESQTFYGKGLQPYLWVGSPTVCEEINNKLNKANV
jgi:hypothetical protein